jgi:hypothetical protein
MTAGVVRLHVESRRYVLFNPVTQQPLTNRDGNCLYDPTYNDVAAVAILYGALHPQDTAKFTEYWFRYVNETTAAKRHATSAPRRNRRARNT